MVATRKTPFKKVQEIPDLVRHLDEIFREIQQNFLYGVEIKDVALSTTASTISHKLGRAPIGWMVTRKNGQGDIWESSAPDSRFLNLISDATPTVTLWVW